MNTSSLWRRLAGVLALGAAALLAGCGDGSSPAATRVSLSGTAAIGATLNNAPVVVTCASGRGTATTNGSGTYSISIEGGSGPCVVEVTDPVSGVTLKGLAVGTGSQITANVTPLTTAFVQYVSTLSGASTGTATVSASALLADTEALALLKNPTAVQNRIVNDFISALVAAVAANSGGTTTLTISVTNFLSAPINPANDTNGADADLEKLKTALGVSSGTTTAYTLPTTFITTIVNEAKTDATTSPIVVSTTGLGS